MNFSRFTTTPKVTTGTPLEFWTNLLNANLQAGTPKWAEMAYINGIGASRKYMVVVDSKSIYEGCEDTCKALTKSIRTGGIL